MITIAMTICISQYAYQCCCFPNVNVNVNVVVVVALVGGVFRGSNSERALNLTTTSYGAMYYPGHEL
eukprot:3552996-Amphidinium_carterae.1